MARKSRENSEISTFIVRNVTTHAGDIAALTAQAFNVTRVTANRYLDRLVSQGLLEAKGKTRARKYTLRNYVEEEISFPVTPQLEENVVWMEKVLPLMEGIPKNVLDICQYGFTEMVNNVIDHSESSDCSIFVEINALSVHIAIRDYGIGIFDKIKQACGLSDPRHALLELSKGKLTTDPSKHTGEGIFFTSRMFQKFDIMSGELFYSRFMEHDDEWLIEVEDRKKATKGTLIYLTIPTGVTYSARDVFKKYEDEDHGFVRTHVPVRLARYDTEQLVSRSQARRVLARFNRFTEVLLDFKDVGTIGQAFADEIFRVFKNEHPEVEIIPLRTSPEVQEVIDHVRAEKAAQDQLPRFVRGDD
jgi:anti-sigma regulatory factor (Ser/Thr protein kinase)